MRLKKSVKILLIALGAPLLLLFLAMITFVWSPFEGSFADLRDAVPRNVDFYLRKRDLAADFPEFPEPKFFSTFRNTQSYDKFLNSGLYRQVNAGGATDRALEELKGNLAQMRANHLDLLADAIGHDLILAGQLTGAGIDSWDWCGYARVSWKIRLGLGLLKHSWARSFVQGLPLTAQEDGIFSIALPRQPRPLLLALVKDLLLISPSKDVLNRSLRLARGESKEDTFGRIAKYVDQIRAPKERWEKITGEAHDPFEFDFNLTSALRSIGYDGRWPNGNSPDDWNERALSLFLDPKAHRDLTGNVFIHEDGLAVSAVSSINRDKISALQRQILDLDAQPTDKWARSFLSTYVPQHTALVAMMRVPLEAVMEELFLTLMPEWRSEVNRLVEGTQMDKGKPLMHFQDLIHRIGPAFLPYVAVMIRAQDPDWDTRYGKLDCPVKPAPIPAIALCFWIKPGEGPRIRAAFDWFDQNSKRLLFQRSWQLPARNSWKIREWCNQHIEGTGEIAAIHMDLDPQLLFLSNSGPFIKDIVDLSFRPANGSILDNAFFTGVFGTAEVTTELPTATSGLMLVQGAHLREVVRAYQEFSARRFTANVRDPVWEMEQRQTLEPDVLRRLFPQAMSKNRLGVEELRRFEQELESQLKTRWSKEMAGYNQKEQAELDDLALLASTLANGYLHLRCDPQGLRIQSRVQVEFR